MGDHLSLERYYWFDTQMRAGLFPNAAGLAGHFEVSSKTAQLSIDFMRDRLGAPLEYDPSRFVAYLSAMPMRVKILPFYVFFR